MGTGRGKINSKEQQFAGGNWGHPRPDVKKRTEIADPLMQEEPKHLGAKKYKKKKVKVPFYETWYTCPFCRVYLGKIDETKDHWYIKNHPDKDYGVSCDNVNTVCKNCRAFEVKDSCPSCKRDTWFKADDETLTTGEYAHDKKSGCSFRGRKIIKNDNKK